MTFLYDGGENETDDERRELIKRVREVSQTRWQNFLLNKVMFSSEGEDDNVDDAINAVSGAMVDYLTDLDIAPSDLAMGLMLLRWQSLQWIGGQSRVPAEDVLEHTDPVRIDLAAPLDTKAKTPIEKLEKNWLHISRLKRYSHLVNASYGWLYYYRANPCDCVALHRLCRPLSCRNPTAPDCQIDLENGITGPGGCFCAGRNCYLAAFLEMSQLETRNILVFDITDKLYDASVMLVIDDITEAIVVIVLGTLSGSDILIDLVAAGEPLRNKDHDLPEDKRFVAHCGMGRTARNIASRILEEHWIESARQLRPDYPVVITGHGLGAGLVSLMCVFLKPHYPEVKAYAFSPPGGLMNKNLADFTHDFLCSVTYGYDCVGRIGSQTMEDLRARIFHALCIYKTPKFRALSKLMCLKFARNLFSKSHLPPVIKLDSETRNKLIDPDMNDAYATLIGSKFKPYLQDRITGATKIDRLLPSDRSLMMWKNPNCRTLLVLPRPYPQHLYPESLLEPKKQKLYTLDLMMGSMLHPVPSGHLLHIIEVDKDFEIEGVQTYNKRNYVPPPIALWANVETFNSILVHPKMLSNHQPVNVSTALNRLYDNIMHPENIYHKIHLNTYQREATPYVDELQFELLKFRRADEAREVSENQPSSPFEEFLKDLQSIADSLEARKRDYSLVAGVQAENARRREEFLTISEENERLRNQLKSLKRNQKAEVESLTATNTEKRSLIGKSISSSVVAIRNDYEARLEQQLKAINEMLAKQRDDFATQRDVWNEEKATINELQNQAREQAAQLQSRIEKLLINSTSGLCGRTHSNDESKSIENQLLSGGEALFQKAYRTTKILQGQDTTIGAGQKRSYFSNHPNTETTEIPKRKSLKVAAVPPVLVTSEEPHPLLEDSSTLPTGGKRSADYIKLPNSKWDGYSDLAPINRPRTDIMPMDEWFDFHESKSKIEEIEQQSRCQLVNDPPISLSPKSTKQPPQLHITSTAS
ncbi:hypothetical protein Aperf_G00000048946 [Anoplocephala perfoliata]